jgi:hypothetical protein
MVSGLMSAPTLTVLIATLGQRRGLLGRLLFGLMPQVDAAAGRVKVLAYWDNGETDLAVKRQALVEAAGTDYVCHVDDDDTVTNDYVESILGALESWPDIVGLHMMVHRDGEPLKVAELSTKFTGWYEEPDRFCRDITHENPIRTSLARSVDFRDKATGDPEDAPWAAKLRGRITSEVTIERVLYHYWWIPGQSAWGAKRRDRITATDHRGKPWRPLPVPSPYFAWHPDSPLPGDLPMTDMLIVVPSRSRPQNVGRLVEAWQSTGALAVASMRVDVDVDDPTIAGYRRLAESFPRGVRLAEGHRWRPLVWKLNRATRQECESYFALGFMGDDHLPRTDEWAQRYLDELRDLGTGIVYGDDGYQHENTPTQWAMTADICRALGGKMVPAPVDHLYCDDAVRDLGKAAGCLRYLPDVMIEHVHPSAGKAERDAQYVRVNSQAQYAKDRPQYQGWRDGGMLAGQADAVRALREH